MENGSDPKKFLYYAGSLFCLVLSVWFAINLFQPSWFKNIKAEVTQQPYARTVTVTAEGKLSAAPDIAKINLAVVSQGKTVKQVTADGNQKMTQVIEAVKKLGVDPKDITTTQYNLTPEYRYIENRSPEITGYLLTQDVAVKVRKLDIVDDVLDMSIKAGANQVGQLSFDIDDMGPLKKDAREKAFKMAREKADQMATSAGVRLGRVVTFSENMDNSPVYPNYAMDRASFAEGAPAPSVQPGTKELSVNVSVTYEIE